MATIKVAESGTPVDLFSLVPVKRSHSVCAQGGINGAVNTKGEGDSPWEHYVKGEANEDPEGSVSTEPIRWPTGDANWLR